MTRTSKTSKGTESTERPLPTAPAPRERFLSSLPITEVGPRTSVGEKHPRTVSVTLLSALRPAPYSFYCQVVELWMCALSNRIRESPSGERRWKTKQLLDDGEKALQQAEDEQLPVWNLTPAMVRPAFHLTVAVFTPNPILQGQIHARGASWVRGRA